MNIPAARPSFPHLPIARALLLLLLPLLVAAVATGQTKPKVYVVPEAAQLNALFTALGGAGWSTKTGWPVPSGEQTTQPTPYGVGFDKSETELPDRVVVTCTVGALGLSYNNLVGPMPAMSFSALTVLDFEGNKLSGPIVAPQCPNLEYLYLNVNQLTGSIPALPYPNLKSLFLNSNQLTGSIPDFATSPGLEVLALEDNNLTGSIPAFTQTSFIGIVLGNNQLSGPIPDFAMPRLLNLYLDNNALTGSLPRLAGCPKLANFNASENKLSGTIPAYTQPDLISLMLNNNQLTGPIPNLALPMLQMLFVNDNQLTGPLPVLSTPMLASFVASRNRITGGLPAYTLPKLTQFNVENNQLEGTVPTWSFPELTSLNVRSNRLTGTFGMLTAPNLQYIDAGANRFDSLVVIPSRFPKIKRLWCDYNRLTFEELLPNTGISQFYYSPQANVPTLVDEVGGVRRFRVQVGGTGNRYQWYRDTTALPGETRTELLVPAPGTSTYTCRITNPQLPLLTLVSDKPADVVTCMDVGPAGTPWLRICITNAEWQTINLTTKKTASGAATINDILRFTGVITVDTAYYKLSLDGVLSIPDVPLPFGGMTEIVLARGNYVDLEVLDSGRITRFFERTFPDSMSILGTKATLKDLRFAGGFPPRGITIAVGLALGGLRGTCGGKDPKQIELDINELTISLDDGITVDAELRNVGLYFPGWCLNSMQLAYDQSKDVWRAGAQVKMPLGTVGGGLGISKGQVDSIAWRLESSFPPKFVLGTTSIGISGFFGHVSGMTGTELEVELGGIFTDITSENLYNVDVAGMFKKPALLQGRAEPHILRLPGQDFWQIVGEASLSYDFSQWLMKLAGEIRMCAPSEGKYYVEAKGALKMSNKWSPPRFAGALSGRVEIPKLSDGFPYGWLSTLVSFPVVAACDIEFSRGRFSFVAGGAAINTGKSTTHQLAFLIDLSRPANDPNYFMWKYGTSNPVTGVTTGPGRSSVFALRTDQIPVASGTTLTVIEVRGSGATEAGTLRDPSGTAYNASSGDEAVTLSRSTDARHVYWTLAAPAQGVWTLERTKPAATDTMRVYTVRPPAPFAITVAQTGRDVHVSWNPAGMQATDSVYVQLDEDATGNDGDVIAIASASTGTATFSLGDDLAECSYDVLATHESDDGFRTAYGGRVVNDKTGLLPPPDIRVSYDTQHRSATVRWSPTGNPLITGYLVHLVDDDGRDTVVADLFASDDQVTLQIAAPDDKNIALQCYDEQGRTSCLSALADVLVTVARPDALPAALPVLHANYPNPFNPSTVVRFTLPQRMPVRLVVCDLFGRVVARLADAPMLDAGTHQCVFTAGTLASGVYLVRLETPATTRMHRMLLVR